MRKNEVHKKVKEVLEESKKARNDNFYLVYKVYEKLNAPVKSSFMNLMIEHTEYKLPSFESVLRARRKVVEQQPELNCDEKIKELREEQEYEYLKYSLNM